MLSNKAFTMSLALSGLLHAGFAVLLSGHAFLSPKAEITAGRTIRIQLVAVTVDEAMETRLEEPAEVPDLPEEDEEPVLRFVNPEKLESLPIPVPEPNPVLPAPEPAPAATVLPELEEVLPQPVEITGASAAQEESYWDTVRTAVAREIRFPPAPRRRKSEEIVMLRLVIDSSGGLVEAGVLPPPADAALTRAALQAVHRAAPFAPPAQYGLADSSLIAELPIRFRAGRGR